MNHEAGREETYQEFVRNSSRRQIYFWAHRTLKYEVYIIIELYIFLGLTIWIISLSQSFSSIFVTTNNWFCLILSLGHGYTLFRNQRWQFYKSTILGAIVYLSMRFLLHDNSSAGFFVFPTAIIYLLIGESVTRQQAYQTYLDTPVVEWPFLKQ